jgi:hypothetical protein
MNLRNSITGWAFGAMTLLATASTFAAPIFTGNTIYGPATPTGGALQQVCPEGAVSCPGQNFTEPANNFFQFTMLDNGVLSAAIVSSISATSPAAIPPIGVFNILAFQITDLADVPLAGGSGSLVAPLVDFALAAGTYRMWIDFDYDGFIDNASASWAMPITTGQFGRQVPEPGSLALLGVALTAIALAGRRRRS